MKTLHLFATLVLTCSSLGNAQEVQYDQLEVKGLPDTPKSNQDGFSGALLDSGSDVHLVKGVAMVRDSVGKIESAQLLVRDQAGKNLMRAVLLPWRVDGQQVSNMEFDLRRDLLEKSYIVIRSQKGDTVTISKVMLGTFHVPTLKK